MNPDVLWNSYHPTARASVNLFGDYDPYNLKVCFPKIQCVYFTSIDRGVSSWSAFNNALKTWFPQLKTLMFNQNYSMDSDEEFQKFMKDQWLEHIWIEDFQSSYNFINTTNKLRVFNAYHSCDKIEFNELRKLNIDSFDSYNLYYKSITDEEIVEIGHIVLMAEQLQLIENNQYSFLDDDCYCRR